MTLSMLQPDRLDRSLLDQVFSESPGPGERVKGLTVSERPVDVRSVRRTWPVDAVIVSMGGTPPKRGDSCGEPSSNCDVEGGCHQ
jgi:hypothetical protein